MTTKATIWIGLFAIQCDSSLIWLWAAATTSTTHAIQELLLICLLYDVFECFLEANIFLRRSLIKADAILLCEQLTLFFTNLPPIRQINLIANKNPRSRLISMLLNWLNPILNTLKRLFVSHVIWNDDAVGSSIKWVCDCAESFLACGIPYFYWHLGSISFCRIFLGGKI